MKDESEHGGPEGLRRRTLDLALRIIRLCGSLPNTPEAWAIRRQLVRSGTAPGAHYREACRARSDAEFISKIEGGLMELDETAYWLEILEHSKICTHRELTDLQDETDQLIRIFVACSKNAKRRSNP